MKEVARMPVRPWVVATFAVAILLAPRARAQMEAGENAMIGLWKANAAAPDDHEGIIAACRAFRDRHAAFAPVADTLAAWHELRAARTNAFVSRMESIARSRATDAISKAAVNQARGWLTRLDREAVNAALWQVYLKEVEYPPSLEVLEQRPNPPPLEDRWERPWIYRLRGFKVLTGLRGQRFQLESARLSPDTDLAPALKRPYGAGRKLIPRRFVSRSGGRDILELDFVRASGETERLLLATGATRNRVLFAYRGKRLLVLSDGDYWHIVPPPR